MYGIGFFFIGDIIINNRVDFTTLQEQHKELLISNGYEQSSFKDGGTMIHPSITSGDTFNSFNGGGTHEQNPYGGIPQGNGNTVEHGETSFDTENGKFIYVINEYGGSITSIKKTDSGFEQIDLDSTLDKNYKGINKCADIHLSKDERFLYGSNRGENTIAVFKRNTVTGMLKKIQNTSVHGDWPRNFTLDSTGRFLLVANQRSHNISVFKINILSGKLKFLHDVKAASPVCLLF